MTPLELKTALAKQADPQLAVQLIDEFLSIEPIIRQYQDLPFLQSVSFTTEEEVLAHLLNSDDGMTTAALTAVIPKAASGVRQALRNMSAARCSQVVQRSGKWLITDLGIARIEDRIVKETPKSSNGSRDSRPGMMVRPPTWLGGRCHLHQTMSKRHVAEVAPRVSQR